ncbi:hypothetical protein COO60DRAFT_722370 [Scenedesmus sp. NREL 46B-D3]|nr:hypothetical protein COO60DRAFT_722370 [Scenedesmus sp. NREL 46B-D3]
MCLQAASFTGDLSAGEIQPYSHSTPLTAEQQLRLARRRSALLSMPVTCAQSAAIGQANSSSGLGGGGLFGWMDAATQPWTAAGRPDPEPLKPKQVGTVASDLPVMLSDCDAVCAGSVCAAHQQGSSVHVIQECVPAPQRHHPCSSAGLWKLAQRHAAAVAASATAAHVWQPQAVQPQHTAHVCRWPELRAEGDPPRPGVHMPASALLQVPQERAGVQQLQQLLLAQLARLPTSAASDEELLQRAAELASSSSSSSSKASSSSSNNSSSNLSVAVAEKLPLLGQGVQQQQEKNQWKADPGRRVSSTASRAAVVDAAAVAASPRLQTAVRARLEQKLLLREAVGLLIVYDEFLAKNF